MKILFGFFVVLMSSLITFYLISPQFKEPKLNSLVGNVFDNHLSPTPFSLINAPTESLKGELTVLSNDVFWQDRVATESSKINQNTTVQQGERIETDDLGLAEILFPNELKITISNNTLMDIVQTLPVNLVFSLTKGQLNLRKLGVNTLSVRSKHLLINIDGEINIELDKEKPTVSLSVISGSATLAYNSLKYETQSLNITTGQNIEFNDSTRKVVVK